ncbi:MAG TPA: ComF family protein [Terriglobales bacterium]|nr:ComF family protein [Terriglobales bacterium]
MCHGGQGRVVFSSSGDLTRATRAESSGSQSSLVSLLGAAAESLFATLLPGNCRLCSAPLTKISRLPVCEACLQAMHPIAGLVCGICGERLASPYAVSEGVARCGACQRLEPLFAKAVAYGSYEGGLRELIHLLKYEQVRPAAGVLGRMLGEAVGTVSALLGQVQPLVVPVPLHAAKLRQRGFNQSELIARAALKSPALIGVSWPLHSGVLERSRPTESQTGLTRHQRRENIRGAFRVNDSETIAGRSILLVDDVFTTGTTVSECARVLRKAGAAQVWVATVARVLRPELPFAVPENASEKEEAAPEPRAMAATV